MFNYSDEIISTSILGDTSDSYEDFERKRFIDFLQKSNGKVITTLSGKKQTIDLYYAWDNWNLKTENLNIRIVDCAFGKFCDCFPYNKNITYQDLLELIHYNGIFKKGVMSPNMISRFDDALAEYDLFYGLVFSI